MQLSAQLFLSWSSLRLCKEGLTSCTSLKWGDGLLIQKITIIYLSAWGCGAGIIVCRCTIKQRALVKKTKTTPPQKKNKINQSQTNRQKWKQSKIINIMIKYKASQPLCRRSWCFSPFEYSCNWFFRQCSNEENLLTVCRDALFHSLGNCMSLQSNKVMRLASQSAV